MRGKGPTVIPSREPGASGQMRTRRRHRAVLDHDAGRSIEQGFNRNRPMKRIESASSPGFSVDPLTKSNEPILKWELSSRSGCEGRDGRRPLRSE
jgi:hypothetical protein